MEPNEIIERLVRLETKVDMLLEKDKRRFDIGWRAGIALFSSMIAILIAIFK